MKIERVRSQIVSVPQDEPLAGGKGLAGATREFVVVKISTSSGIDGIGLTFFGGPLSGALKSAVDSFGERVIGQDPLQLEAIIHRLRFADGAGTAGPAGIFTLALAAIDIALWDIRGKEFNLPLARMLGGFRDRVPAYASGALMRTAPLEEVAVCAGRLVERGYKQMKAQLALPGDTSPARELERIRAIRENAGDDVTLMVDINQRWSVAQAIDMGRRLEPYHLAWLEDVTVADDYAGLARVGRSLPTPLAGGEYLYGIVPFRHMMEARSVGITMIDVFRVGGITQWMKVAGMAEAFNLPVVSHLVPEINLHLIAAIPNGLVVENMPWSMHLYEDPPLPVAGEYTVPSRPGLGLAFTKEIDRQLA